MLTFAIDNVRCILWWIYSPTCNGSSINNWYPTPVNNTTHIICNIGHYITNRTTNYLLRTGDISHATKFIIRSHISITNSPDTLCRWKTRKSLILARLRCLVAKTNSIHVVRSSSVATIAKIFESTSVTVTTLNVFHLSYCSKITDKKKTWDMHERIPKSCCICRLHSVPNQQYITNTSSVNRSNISVELWKIRSWNITNQYVS